LGADLARGVNHDQSAGASGGETPTANNLWKTALMRTGTGSYTTVDATAPARDGLWDGVDSWYDHPDNRPGFAYRVTARRAPVHAQRRDRVPPTPRGSSLTRASGRRRLSSPGSAGHG
jgi:hypothetical protein